MLKAQVAQLNEYSEKLVAQRNSALSATPPTQGTPFYVWILFGVAGGILITRGLR